MLHVYDVLDVICWLKILFESPNFYLYFLLPNMVILEGTIIRTTWYGLLVHPAFLPEPSSDHV